MNYIILYWDFGDEETPCVFDMFNQEFFHTPAGISSRRPQSGHEATSSVQRQSAPDQVGPELSLVLVPPGTKPLILASRLHGRLPARCVGTHVLHVPRV